MQLLSNGVNAIPCTALTFPSIVIDEIKCYEGGHFTLEGDSLP